LILFAHGSKDPGWAEPFEKLARQVRRSAPGPDVRLAYLELMQPSLPQAAADAIAAGATSICIVPVFLAQGGHVRRDLAALVDELRKRHPRVGIDCASPAGEDEAVLAAIAAYAVRQLSD
jgi:sirohydrochlorin cobaltochelatase